MRFASIARLTIRLGAQLWLWAFCVVLTARAEHHVDVLDVGGHFYSNVTVTARTPTHLFIQHSRGFAGVKIEELSDANLAQLGYGVAEKKPASGSASASASAGKMSLSIKSLKLPVNVDEWREFEPKFSQTDEQVEVEVNHQSFSLNKHLFKGVLACLAMAYVIFCHSATLICRKSGLKPGIWCWLPIVQLGWLLRAAHLPAWWVLFWLFPLTALPVWMVWSVKICRVRGKGFFTTLLLLLPATSPLAFVSLALGGGGNGPEEQVASEPEKLHLKFEDAM